MILFMHCPTGTNYLKMRKLKLLLINPVSQFRKGFLRSDITRYPPLAYGIISALTPDNWDVELIDENYEDFEYQEADLVGLTGYTSSIYRAYQIADIYKEKNIPVVIGGIHASMMPNEACNYADSVVVGEAESCWKDVIGDFENSSMKKFYYGKRLALDNIPPIDYSIFNRDYMVGSTITTRGCPFDCEFCTVTAFNGNKYRMRPVENVLDEIEKIPQDKFFFVDDNIIGYSKASKEHAADVFRGIIDRGIKKYWWSQASLNFANEPELLKLAYDSGCRLIFIGVEAETIEGIDSTNKKLNAKIGTDKYNEAFNKIRHAGISVLGSFIFGLDSDNIQDIRNRAGYIKSANIDCYQMGILTPMPGTKTFFRLEKEGRINKNNYPEDWQYYSVEDITFEPAKMGADELMHEMRDIWYDLFSRKSITRKFLSTLRATKDVEASTWALATNMSYRNMAMDVFGDEKFDIESLIGPYKNMLGGDKK